VRQRDARNHPETELAGGEHPAVAGDDPAGGVCQHRVGKAKGLDAGGGLLDLGLAVRPRVAGIGDELADRPVHDRQVRLDQL
jgi:hypothetical protein